MSKTVVIVGAGPAGMMAAREVVRRGGRAILLDEAARPGGQIYRQAASSERAVPIGLAGELARKKAVLEAFAEVAGSVDYHAEATAFSLFPGLELHAVIGGKTHKLHPDAVILATGVSERAVPFPGWTLPGVVFAGGIQATLKAHGVRAGTRIVVAGAGPLPLAVGAQLIDTGAKVPAVALVNPISAMLRHAAALWAGRDIVAEGRQYMARLKGAGTDLLQGWIPVRANGDERLRSVTLARHDGGRPVPGSERTIDCDVLAINFGFVVNSELARMAGAEAKFDPNRGGWVPVRDAYGRTSVPGVFVAGDGAGLRGALVAAPDGQIVGAAAMAGSDGDGIGGIERELAMAISERRRHEKFQDAVQELLRLPDGVWSLADQETTICRCECVTRARIERAVEDGHVTLNAIKKNSRAGMGWCGGRICLHSVAALSAGGKLGPGIEQMTPRPVARLVTIGDLVEEVVHD
jgi:thioredoxin reductase